MSELKWWCISQNNSGGEFEVNSHVAKYVFIQAPNWVIGEALAEKIIYGNSHMGSCPCCGDRWSWWIGEEDGTPDPTIYGKPVLNYNPIFAKAECRFHYYDGTIKPFTLTRSEK